MLGFFKKLLHHEKTSKQEKVISAVLAFAYVIGMGSYGQGSMQSEWFKGLIRPDVQPPDFVFGLVWSLLFILIGLSGYYAWNFYKSKTGRKTFALLYIVNGLLMAGWTHQFFVNHNMTTALYMMIGLIVIIEAMIVTGFYTNRNASYLLMPYLLWILFATYLNTSYIILNS